MLRNASKAHRGGKPWGAKGHDGRDAHSFGAGGTGGGGDESYIVGGVPLTFQESSAATEPTAPSTIEPSTTTALGAFSLFFVISALAATGGIGGGALYVPLLSLSLQLPPQTSVGLSQGMIFGSALGALAVNAPSRHPLAPRRPLIDLGVAAFLAPMEMAGAQIGVLLNRAVPAPITLLLMALILSLTAVFTLAKGLEQRAVERRVPNGGKSGSTVRPASPSSPEEAVTVPHLELRALPEPPSCREMAATGGGKGDLLPADGTYSTESIRIAFSTHAAGVISALEPTLRIAGTRASVWSFASMPQPSSLRQRSPAISGPGGRHLSP